MSDRFPDRVRFNWGFHDGASAVRRGRDCPEHNYGFLRGYLVLRCEEDIPAQHCDQTFAAGYLAGMSWAREGLDTSSSETAWLAHQIAY